MEERKTAAWVLGVIAMIVIFFTVILPEIRIRATQTVSFNKCTVNFEYWSKDLETDIYNAAQNKLGLCLCQVYKQKPDTSVGNRILQIYRNYGNHNHGDSVQLYNNIDSIIKYKSVILDTLVLVD